MTDLSFSLRDFAGNRNKIILSLKKGRERCEIFDLNRINIIIDRDDLEGDIYELISNLLKTIETLYHIHLNYQDLIVEAERIIRVDKRIKIKNYESLRIIYKLFKALKCERWFDFDNMPHIEEEEFDSNDKIAKERSRLLDTNSFSFLRGDYDLAIRGMRPAGKIELNSRQELMIAKESVRRYFPFYRVVYRDNGMIDLYYSLDDEIVEIISNVDNVVDRDSIIKTGELFGYPRCCSESYIGDRFHLMPNYLIKWMYKRYRSPDRINALFNPFLLGPNYFPCDLTCKETLKRLIVLKETIMDKDKRALLNYPVLFLYNTDLKGPPVRGIRSKYNFAIIRFEDKLCNGFRYSVKWVEGIDDRLRYIEKGDRLYFKNGIIRVFKGSKHIFTFYFDANIWYYKKAFHRIFWNRFLSLLFSASLYYLPVFPEIKRVNENLNMIRRRLYPLREDIKGYGFDLKEIYSKNNLIILRLLDLRTKRIVELSIQPLTEVSNYYMKGDRFAVSIYSYYGELNGDYLNKFITFLLNRIEEKIHYK